MVDLPSRVLITGGLGYLGGRIATHLRASAPEMALRLMTRRHQDQVPDWANGLDLVLGNVLEERSLEAALGEIDTVIHLAATNEIDSLNDPDLALEVNGRGTYRLLRACHRLGVQRFIYFSTFHVYGPREPQPITEDTPTRPVHPYAITHRLAEDYVNWYGHSYGMDTLVLRLSNGYGYPADPGVQRWTLVFNDLCRQAVQRQEIRLKSRGTQHRDFVALTDVARGVRHLLGLSSQGWGSGLFNLGGECSLSIMEAAKRVAAEYLQRYAQEVPIYTTDAGAPQDSHPVIYSIEKLKRTGFSLLGNMSQEVQGTFETCERLVAEGDLRG